MPTARIDLIAVSDDESRRRREQRRSIKALAVLGGLFLLAFAGREPEPALLRLNSAATDFGTQAVGSRTTKEVALRNATDEPFVVAGIVAEGTATPDFSVDMTKCGQIAPGTNCVASVTFAPRDAGQQSAKFHVVDASNEASETIVVRGAGEVPPPLPSAVAQPALSETPPVVTPPVIAPEPEPIPQPMPVMPPPAVQPKPPAVQPKPPAPKPAPQVIEVPMPIEEPPVVKEPPAVKAPPAVKEPPVVKEPEKPIEEPIVEKPAAPQEPAPQQQPAPQEQPQPPKESKFKKFLKKAAPVAAAVIVGAVIANNANHDHKSNRRITLTRDPSSQTGFTRSFSVTSVGRDPVTIRSVRIGATTPDNNCQGRTLAPQQTCRISISPNVPSGTVVVDSDGGSASADFSLDGYHSKE